MAVVISKQFSLNSYDFSKWLYNAIVFLIPVGLVFLGELTKLIPSDWQYGAVALYFLNLLTDIVKKWATTNSYKK